MPEVIRQIDYERIASAYNARYVRPAEQELRGQALLKLAAQTRAQRILEVGCGTGHWLSGLVHSGATLYGLDFSAGMLRQLQGGRLPIGLTQASAEALPYTATSFDLIYCVDTIHQFEEKRQFLREAYRLLLPGGVLAIIGADPHCGDVRWFAYDYFAGTREFDLQRFAAHAQLQGWLAESGFEEITSRQVDVLGETKLGAEILKDLFLQQNASSQLALLSAEDYATGVARIQAALAAAKERGETLKFESKWPVHMITAHRPTPQK